MTHLLDERPRQACLQSRERPANLPDALCRDSVPLGAQAQDRRVRDKIRFEILLREGFSGIALSLGGQEHPPSLKRPRNDLAAPAITAQPRASPLPKPVMHSAFKIRHARIRNS